MEKYTTTQHDLAVQKLATEVSRFHAAQVPFRINHGSTNSTRARDPKTPQLKIAHLNHVLNIDVEKETATVEPNVPLDSLVSKCLEKGFMPLVVMEFPGITVGGGFSGASGESTGWKEGLFDCSIEEIEIILGNGQITYASQDGKNSDLFNGARCTLGTLGVITLLKVRLMHARETRDSHTEIVPIQSYLFRHDRGAFWSGELFLKYFGLPNNRFARWLVDPMTKARAIYQGMLSTDSADGAIIQDFLLPVETSEAFVEYIDKELGIWPIWICPIRRQAGGKENVGWPFYKSAVSEEKDEMTLNFGVWGPTDPTPEAFRRTNRVMEQKLRELRGMKVPYAANFYTEEEFWSLYDREKYESTAEEMVCRGVAHMYDKVRRKQSQDVPEQKATQDPQTLTWKDWVLDIWPLGGLYQIAHAVFK
jgi:hypothetical protein